MKAIPGSLRLSASDLSNHLGCRHLTQLNRAVANGLRKAPTFFDGTLAALQARGEAHEKAYLSELRRQGLTVVEIDREGGQARTLEAMKSGADVIAQAALTSGRWVGYADVLRRMERKSALGAWSYEVYDTKLARETKAGAVLQLCLYSDLLMELQGERPERMYIVSPGSAFPTHPLRFDDYAAYYRFVRRRLEEAVDAGALATYPEPCPRCESCNWAQECDRQRRADDHLSLVAGISRMQRRELEGRTVSRLEALASLPETLGFKPERGSAEALARVRNQAEMQLRERRSGKPEHALLRPEPLRGLARLPAPSKGDVFFDIEGDPFVGEAGLEYLLGYAWTGADGQSGYSARWALNAAEEKRIFEEFVDDVIGRWMADPSMHVYHFAPYEPSALRRLMGRHGTREEEVDRMLRAGRFVDLYAVTRQGVLASVESYSIKQLARFFGYERDVALKEVGASKRALEATLELAGPSAPAEIAAEWRDVVETYNRDDCVAAMKLRDWLETLRARLVAEGNALVRPEAKPGDVSEAREAENEVTRALREKLLRSDPAAPHVLLAQLVDFHWREDKVGWWDYFRLRELSAEELRDDPDGLSALELVETVSRKKVAVERYRFPEQELEIDEGDDLHLPESVGEGKAGTVEAIDVGRGIVDIKRTQKTEGVTLTAVFKHDRVPSDALEKSIARIAESVAENGIDAAGPHRAGRDLLLRVPPRLNAGGRGLRRQAGEDSLGHARRVVLELEEGVLPIQGPPGAGKTYTGARMILALVQAGKRVGVTAVSHRVVRNLLDEVMKAAAADGLRVSCGQRVPPESVKPESPVTEFGDSKKAVAALRAGEVQVLGGTSWVWAADGAVEACDVLFVDEAGQLSLANALAASRGAKSLVLLGDPRQLEQPKRGSHPEGAEVSALEHLVGDRLTIPEELGLFLEETHRLHPKICDELTSKLFYEGRLKARPGLARQRVDAPPISGAGLWYVPVVHEANQNCSVEEVDAIEELVRQALVPGATWTTDEGVTKPLTATDVLIVAPYNAQVRALRARLPALNVGTVDKFQGQQAPIVIVSMTSSSAEDAPRGMEFLYSANRLNVATSRAKCACILVASPRLFEPECRTPRQMQLANAFCRYREVGVSLRRS